MAVPVEWEGRLLPRHLLCFHTGRFLGIMLVLGESDPGLRRMCVCQCDTILTSCPHEMRVDHSEIYLNSFLKYTLCERGLLLAPSKDDRLQLPFGSDSCRTKIPFNLRCNHLNSSTRFA